jgi:hypothetical protein
MNNHDEGAQIGASLETLARQISERWRQELAALRTALDRQMSSLESRLSESDHKTDVQAAVEQISEVAAERADQARLEAETTAAQALAAIEGAMRARLESAQATIATAEAARTATEAQHRQTLKENKKLTAVLNEAQTQLLDIHAQLTKARREAESNRTSLAESQKQAQALTAERAELQRRLKDLTTAKATAEAQYRELVTASHTLTDALSQMQRDRERVRPVAPPAAPLKSVDTPTSAAKKPLSFSEPARDAQRVKIRRGIMVDIDGIPGELVDLSIGGAQTLLTQAVKPNQLVRLSLPEADGELICKGRIVWVVFEQPATSLSVYRSGVKFTDADRTAVEKYMNDFCEKPTLQHSGSEDTARIS